MVTNINAIAAKPANISLKDPSGADRRWRESWAMPWTDFITEVLSMVCGAKRKLAGFWELFGKTVCDRGVCCDGREFSTVGAEPGWSKWDMPGRDGVVRTIPRDVPCVARSPSGALFWCPAHGGTPRRIWSIGDLVRMASYCRPLVGGVA